MKAILLVLVCLAAAGVYLWTSGTGGPGGGNGLDRVQEMSPVERPARQYPRLESRLEELVRAPDPVRYAQTHGIALMEGKVRVLIELAVPDVPPGYGVEVELRQGNRVQALVPVGQLGPLSQAPGVKSVRIPAAIIPLGR